MTTAVTSLIVFVVAGIVLLLVWRAVRFVMRIALIGVLILALLVGALAWWYAASSSTPAQNQKRPASSGRRAPR